MHPKVFVSHASEDKDRFVVKFATRLRDNGVDAWLDKWEMHPGDSLVDKIFEEGLKEAQAVIIVLSKFSVEKPWVGEELNVSIVNRLSKGTKIIPVVLDDCKVPESLTSTLWESITDINDYEVSFKRILSSIFGANDKPALGNAPPHVFCKYSEIGGLTKADNLVLKESCEYIISNNDIMVNPEPLFGEGGKLGFSRSEIKDCIEVLESSGYLKVSRYIGGGSDNFNCHFRVTDYGFDCYARAYLADYPVILDAVVSSIVNENLNSNVALQKKLGNPIVIINHILMILESNSHVKLSKAIGGVILIHHVSPTLKRALV
jgi:hypothetical protein